jgi:GT2 family glycosyltransferase
MLLSVIIISYNTRELMVQTLESVLTEIHLSNTLKNTTEIFVVDNHSTDDSVAAISTLAKKNHSINLFRNTTNLGFAAANNQAIAQAKGKYIFLLNSDTIVHEGSLQKMVEAFEKRPIDESTSELFSQKERLDKLGVLAANLLNKDGSLQPQGGSFPTLFSLASHMFFLDDLPMIGQYLPSTQHTGKSGRVLTERQTSNPQQLDWIGGTAMMLRKQMLEEIGPLDQNIFMYGEDVELCMRAKKHHWDVAVLPSAKITHLGSASSSAKNAIIGEIKGYLYIWSKHKPLWQVPLAKLILSLGVQLRIMLFGLILKDTAKADVYVTALKDVLR